MDSFTSLISELGNSVLETQPELRGAGEELRDQFLTFVPGLTPEQEQRVFTFVATYLSDVAFTMPATISRLQSTEAMSAIATVFAAAGFVGMAEESKGNNVAE